MPPSDELWRWSATSLAAAIRRGDISSREAVESALQRCAAVNGRVNCVVEPMEKALEAADLADRARARGEPLGPLHGVPVTYKINVDVAGRATTDGVAAFRDRVATEDSSPVLNWKTAGAIGIGRTNVPAFSARYFTDNDLYGRTLNPWCPERTPGGSSGGAAAAVACGVGALGHGNDRAGSVRYPAYACGVFGLRPSFGRVPNVNSSLGELTLFSQLANVQGVLARTVEDLRLGYHALAQPDPRDVWQVPVPLETREPAGPCRVALFTTCADGATVAPEVLGALDRAAELLTAAGYRVEPAQPPHFSQIADLFFSLIRTEEQGSANRNIADLGDSALKRARASTMATARQLDLPGAVDAYRLRAAWLRDWQQFLQTYPLVLMPVSRQLPFPIDLDQQGDDVVREMLAAQAPLLAISVLGLPGLAVPLPRADGVPTGVQIVGGRFREELCLRAGAVIEAACPVDLALAA
ncbi:amidase [Amorphus suaedae]